MPDLPRVIFLLENSSDKYGGPIRSVSRLQEYLNNAGISSGNAVVSIGRSPHADGKTGTLENTMTTWQLLEAILRIKRASTGAVIVFNNQWTVMVQAMGLICLMFGLPYIWWIRGVPDFNNFSLKRIVWLVSQKKLLMSADAIICSSTRGLARVQRLLPDTKARLLDVPNILRHTSTKHYNEISRPVSGAEFQSPDIETVKILSVGRFHPSKRLAQLIEVCPKEISGKTVELRLAGYSDDDGFLNMLDQKAQQSGLSLRLMPNALDDEIAVLYHNSDVFISLSRTENFGNAIGEALVAGLPVIITPHTDFWPDFDFEGVFVSDDNDLALSVESALTYNCRNKKLARKKAFEQRWASYATAKFEGFTTLCTELLK